MPRSGKHGMFLPWFEEFRMGIEVLWREGSHWLKAI